MQKNNSIPEDIKLLIVNYCTGSINSQELSVLKNWIDSHTDNLDSFNQLKSAWMLSQKPEQSVQVDKSLLWSRIESEITSSKVTIQNDDSGNFNLLKVLRYAAIGLLLMGLGSVITFYYTRTTSNSDNITEYNVPKGSKSSVKLPDGSVVWLNAGSKLFYSADFDKKERNVYLSGEAYFSVVTNKEKPFRVHTSDLIVRALGTKFNVKAYPEEKTITTTLEEGIIDVQVIKGESLKKYSQIKIKPHEKLVFFKAGENHIQDLPANDVAEEVEKIQRIDKNIKVESDVNTELYTSWKNDKWIIEGLTLKCLAPILERRYNLKIYFSNEELEQYKFSGILQNETVEQILDLLTYTAPVKYNIVKDSIYLSVDQSVKHNFEKIITTRKQQ